MEGTFAPSGRSQPMSWERIRSSSTSNLKPLDSSYSNQNRTLSGHILSERAPLSMTIGDRSIGRYANEKNEPIAEEVSVVERSFVNQNKNLQSCYNAAPQQITTESF